MTTGMGASLRAICSDFYINHKVGVKLDLPRGRETVLELFERVRRSHPDLGQFRRYKDELALETAPGVERSQWVAVRSSNIRSGVVNPDDLGEAYALHRDVLETAPYFMSISPLDIDFVELLFGFDLEARGNHDAIVHRTLFGGSAMGDVLDMPGALPIACQPMLGVALDTAAGGTIEAHLEIKTRGGGSSPMAGDLRERESAEPISVYLTVRRYNPASDLKDLPGVLDARAARGEELLAERIVPGIIVPLREALLSGNG